MSLSDLAFAGLEQAINRYIALDPIAPQRLARDHGRTIRLHLRGLELDLFFVPRQDGRLQLLRRIEGAPDCSLSGSPIDLIRSGAASEGARQLFSGRVSLAGDTELAQGFGNTLAGLDIDWEEQLSKLTGDVLAHQIGRQVRNGRRYAGELGGTFERNLGEYLTEELGLLPGRIETEEQFADIERLRDAVERCEARIERLSRQLAKRRRTGPSRENGT